MSHYFNNNIILKFIYTVFIDRRNMKPEFYL